MLCCGTPIAVRAAQTYKEAIVYPGPRLNLVIGPNGSGKSSIVCAIGTCLLAANKVRARVLGRSLG